MKHFIYFLVVLFSAQFLIADDVEEVTVTASLIDQNLSEIGDPVQVLSGTDLDDQGRASLGESIDDLLGVANADYGFATGQPVIRGLSGSRVKILKNGMVNRDVAGIGVDHPVEIDMNNVQQIEVVRGPSSLLYANGGVGGIINIVDNTIARQDFDGLNANVDFEKQSVNRGSVEAFGITNIVNGINFSYSYENTDFENYDIPDGAVMHSEEEHDEHEGEEDHDEHEEDEHHDEELGYLENSDYERESHKFGFSVVEDWGYIGASANILETHYGIPYHGEGHGGHGGHGDEEEHDEHEGEEDHDEHEEEEGHDAHEGERVFSVTDSNEVNVQGAYNFDAGAVKSINYFIRGTNYSLTEGHAEEGHDEHEGEEDHDEHEGEEDHDEHEGEDDHDEHGHGEEGPTTFSNDSYEIGTILDLSTSNLGQKISINLAKEDQAIVGHEAFMNPTKSDEYTVGYFMSKDFSDHHLDFGVRYDSVSRNGSITETEEHDEHEGEEDHDEHEEEEHHDEHEEEHGEQTFYNVDMSSASLALTYTYDIDENVKFLIGAASVERAPSALELFMNGPHLATGRLETGNVNLNAERSNNIDLTLEFDIDSWYGNVSVYANNITDYIYLQDETEEDHEEEGHDDHGGLIKSDYLQKDAEFTGYELQFGTIIDVDNGEVEVSFGRDSVEGKFASGGYIPRMTPARNFFDVSYSNDDLKTTLSLKDVEEQTKLALNETATEGYQMVDFTISGTVPLDPNVDLKLSFFASNLLDEAARNHNSFVKDQVPLPGRNVGLRFSLRF